MAHPIRERVIPGLLNLDKAIPGANPGMTPQEIQQLIENQTALARTGEATVIGTVAGIAARRVVQPILDKLLKL